MQNHVSADAASAAAAAAAEQKPINYMHADSMCIKMLTVIYAHSLCQ